MHSQANTIQFSSDGTCVFFWSKKSWNREVKYSDAVVKGFRIVKSWNRQWDMEGRPSISSELIIPISGNVNLLRDSTMSATCPYTCGTSLIGVDGRGRINLPKTLSISIYGAPSSLEAS